MLTKSSLITLLFAISAAHAKPYFYFQQAEAQPEQQVVAAVQQAATAPAQQDGQQLPKKITGHLGQLYNHGSTAMRSVVDTVQPDLKNIGQDLTEVYHETASQVGKRIEPLAQTVRPYIAHATKVVAPFVDQAKQEVPKLIGQAGPALSKVSEQMRDGVTNVWGRIAATGQNLAELARSNQQQANQGDQKLSAPVENAIQGQAPAPAPQVQPPAPAPAPAA